MTTSKLPAPLLAGALSLALLASSAQAANGPDPLGSATTTLTLAAPFKRLLATHGVTLIPGKPAAQRGASYTLPLAAGTVDPTASRLSLESEGSLTFLRGNRKVVLRNLSVKTARVPLIAKVGGGQLKIATAERRRFSRQGFDSALSASGLRLTAKVATRLSKKLGLRDVFAEGQLLGSLRAKVTPATVAVQPEGRLAFIPDPAFIAKLDSLFVSLNPIAPAERQSGPLFTVPLIPAGTIAPDGATGVPRTGGSLEFLQLNSGQVFWHELWFDLGAHQVLAEVDVEPTPTFPGRIGQLSILDLDTQGAVASDPKARTVSVSGARLSLNAAAAAQLNQAFAAGGASFTPGEDFGTVSFTVATR